MTTTTISTPATTPGVATTLPHSHSSPATMDAGCDDGNSPDSELKKCGKLLSVFILMLDDSTATFHIQHKALGSVLFDQVCKQLNLLEVDYFGLEYIDSTGMKYWLDHEKPMNRQLGLNLVKPVLKFSVKFYTPDPAQLEEEYTRYLFCLQIKQDLAVGFLQCNDNTAALMASYLVQAECGDYVPEDYPDYTYLSSFKFVPHQDEEMERRIMDNHKKHIGQSPAEADLNLLETARRCELYGIKMYSAKDHEGVPLNLAVAHMGVLVFQNYTKINTFSWAKIRKLSFKRKRFLLKLHPEGYGYYKDTVEFFFEGRNECKNFWKKCVEHHGFFRCAAVKKLPRQKTRVLSRGSSFRYSGRTQKQIVEYVRDNYVKRQPFQRSQSFRHSSSAHSGMRGGLGQSVSAQPLLPFRDGLIQASASQSCGSVVLSNESSPSSLDRKDFLGVDGEKAKTPLANGAVCDNEVDGRAPLRVDEEGRNRPDERTTLTGSHSTLTHDSISLSQEAPETRANDNDDNVSHDSYLVDDQFFQSPEKPGRKLYGEGMENGVDKMHWNESVAKGIEMMKENVINGDIPYVLHRRHYDADLQRSNSAILRQEITKADSLKLTRTSPARVVVELDHPKKNTQTSPTLYARSRFISPPSSLTSPTDNYPTKNTKVVDFVSVHDLPASDSYSSQDDSTGMGSLEQEIFDHLSQRKLQLSGDEKDSQMSTESTEISDDEHTTKLLEEALDKTNGSNSNSGAKFEESDDDEDDDEEETQLTDRKLTELACDSPVEETTWSYTKLESQKIGDTGSEDESERMTEPINSIALLRSLHQPLQIVEDRDGGTKSDLESGDARDVESVMHGEGNDDDDERFLDATGEETTPFDKNFDGHVVPAEVIKIIDVMQREDDLDDDDDDDDIDDEEYVRSGFMFPIRTLSRISERSTSDSKTSSPSESHSKRSDEQNPSIADLPSDLSSSDDNPPPSFESDLSATLYQNQIVLPCEDDEDSKLIETTYYLEINSEQKEQLEKIQLEGGLVYKQEYNLTEGEDTSSADNSTLCEDLLDDIEEQTEAMCSDVETYEGLGVRIHVSPNKSPSPVKTPDQYETSMGVLTAKRRHRSTLQLQVANGQIFEDSQSSTVSPDDDDDLTAFFGSCSRDDT